MAVGVVPAVDVMEAVPRLKEYLNEDHMDILDVWKCERYDSSQFDEDYENNREIKKGVELVKQKKSAVLACGITSEVLDDDSS